MFSFEKKRRLLTKKEYERVFSSGSKTIYNGFIFLHCENTLGYARIGFAIAKKKIAKAHQRNRIKRIVRESFRTQKLPAFDAVVLATKGFSEVENKTIHSNLSVIWKKLTALYAK
jgi:ribonuclease P protein component